MIKTKPETKAKPIVNPVFDQVMTFGFPFAVDNPKLNKAIEAAKQKSAGFSGNDDIISLYLQEKSMQEPNDEKRMRVKHINGIKTDNRPENLAFRYAKDDPWRRVTDHEVVNPVKIPRKPRSSGSGGSSGASL